MRKSIPLVLLALVMLCGFTLPFGKAQNNPPAADAGNKICPVSGDAVSGKDFVVIKGIKYGLCCKPCGNKFKKAPEKYLAALESGNIPAANRMSGQAR